MHSYYESGLFARTLPSFDGHAAVPSTVSDTKKRIITQGLALASVAVALTCFSLPAIAQDMKKMPGMQEQSPMPTATAYRFEAVGTPKPAGNGKNVVSIRLVHNGKPVAGAIFIRSSANMSPMGMATMTAPVKVLGEKPAGTYSFEVQNGSVWKKVDRWQLVFSAKVQGESATVNGSVVVQLKP